MSQITRLLTIAALAVALTVVAMLFVTSPANAQETRIAVCRQFSDSTTQTSDVAGWMNSQLSGGKTAIVSHGSFLCAW